jgi:hypothetical protein
MPTPYAIIDGLMWDLDIEEPVLILSDIDASDKECVEQFLDIALTSVEENEVTHDNK